MIYFLAHSDWILYNSRKEISDNLIRQYGYKVNAITPDGEFKNRLDNGVHEYNKKLINSENLKKIKTKKTKTKD